MIKVNHFMSDELGKMVGDELGSELWQKGMMNEIRRYPNEIPCENGEIPSVIIPKCGGFEKVEWGFTAGMSCLVPKAPGEIEIRNALHFPASATLALLSLLYDEGATNAKSISLTLHIPENAGKFKDYLSRALQKLPNVHAATVSLPAVKDSINTGSDQFTGGSSVASCVGAQVVDVGRIQFSAKLQSGSFKVGDIAAITDGDLNVIARYCPILDLSNAAGQDISATEGCGTTFGAYIAVWFPPNSEFDSLYIVNEGNPVFTPARMPEKPTLNSKNSNVVPNKIPASSADFVIENGVLKKYTGKGGNVVIPDGVTSIGEDAFNRCRRSGFITPDGVCVDGVVVVDKLKELSSVTIPDSVMSIGRCAFYEYESLTDINIPGSVTSIGKEAFCGCISLKNIILPNGINNIDDYTFHKCKNLTSITIPNSVTRIGDGAFECCESLTNITIPDSVKSIGDSAFSLCKSLTSITIHDSVESISDFAFYGCGSLTSVIIPNSVTSIGKWAFNRCGSLTSITIPNSVTTIGDKVFDGCESLTSITIPKRLESAFKDCRSIKKINYTDDANRTGEDGGIVPGGAKSGKTKKAGSESKKQSYIARIEHEQTGGWHQYTVILQPGLNYSWDAIIANADSMADADLAPIMNIQLQTAWGVSKDLIKAYKNSGYRFSETNELTEDEGNMLCIGGISDALGCPTMITWFNQIYAFGITTEKERSDEQIRRYAETIVAKRFGESAVQADAPDEEENSSAGSTDTIGSYRIKKVTQCRTEAGENGMFPQGDSEDDAMAMMDLLMGIRKYRCIYRYEIELDSAPLKWKDCLRAATNMMYLDMLPEHFTYGCGKLEAQPEKDITNSFFNIADCDLRLVPELKNESDFVAVRGSSLNLDVDIKVYFHNGKKLITLYAPIADKEQIQEYAETKLCRVLAVEISGKDTKKERAPASAADTGKAVPSKIPVSSDDFVIENGVLKKYTGAGGNVIIPNGVTRIDDRAFWGCIDLKSITIPDSVTSIGYGAFYGCIFLTRVTIPSSVINIGEEAFYNCLSLADSKGFIIVRGILYGYLGNDTNVAIPKNVKVISSSAFEEREKLIRVNIPNSVTRIGFWAFKSCTSLTSITIPDSVTDISFSAFDGCENLTSVTIPKRLEAEFEDYKFIKEIKYSDDTGNSFWKKLFKK